MYALGKCWKREGWIISVYQRIGDRRATIKIRRARFEGLRRRIDRREWKCLTT